MNIIEIGKTEDHVPFHKVAENGNVRTIKYDSIRGGINVPVGSAPAYYCLYGMEYVEPDHNGHKKPRGKLVFFCEYESSTLSPVQFFESLIADSERYGCLTFYAGSGESESLFKERYQEYTYRLKRNLSPLEQKKKHYPYIETLNSEDDNFDQGIRQIAEWNDSELIDLPSGSTIHDQLSSIEIADLGEGAATNFYAVNALRYMTFAFGKYGSSQMPKEMLSQVARHKKKRQMLRF